MENYLEARQKSQNKLNNHKKLALLKGMNQLKQNYRNFEIKPEKASKE